MKIPEHICQYFNQNPPKSFKWTDSIGEITYELLPNGHGYKTDFNGAIYTVNDRFNHRQNSYVKEYVDGVVTSYINSTWNQQIREICEDT